MGDEDIIIRKIYACPEMDDEEILNYPEISKDELCFNGFDCKKKESFFATIYPYVRENPSGVKYIDIYISYKNDYLQMYKRFVIVDGYCMQAYKEDFFLGLIRNFETYIDSERYRKFNADVINCFPGWNYIDYPVEYKKFGFEHIYYASHRSGPKELLYKAGLFRIAYRLNETKEHNIIASCPQNIFGNAIPIRLLRILNQEEFYYIFYDLNNIEKCKDVYRTYGGYIGDTLPNKCQWNYLIKLYENGGNLAGKGFMRSLYNRLSETNDDNVLHCYEEFLIFRSKVHQLRRWKIPKVNDVYDLKTNLEYLVSVKEETLCDELFIARKKSENYEYKDTKYSVIMPDCPEDFFIEEEILGYWINDKIEEYANGERTILFVRKNEQIKNPYIMMEIQFGEIYHLFAKSLLDQNDEVFSFIEKYAVSKKLNFNKMKLIDDAQWYINYGPYE